MKICAIILDYRGAERTRACLDSLIGQGIDTVLVIDNSESAPASAKLNRAVDALRRTQIDFAVSILCPPANLGFGKGVNMALADHAAAECDHFLLINNDALASPGMVSSLASTMAATHADLIAPVILDASDVAQPVFWYQRFLGLLSSHQLPFSFTYLSGCCLFFRRDLLHDDKLFDEDFFMYGEDALLGWQLARAGKTQALDRCATVRHTGRASSQQYKMFYEYHMARAHVLLALKTWRTPIEIPVLLVTKCIGLLSRALVRCLRSRSLVPLRAAILAWFPLDIRAP